MEQAVTDVRFPQMRRQVILAIAGLADPDHQERIWIRHEFPFDQYFESLDTAIHWLFDDLPILPDPDEAEGDVLVAGDEIERLGRLGRPFTQIIDRLGNAPDRQYLADSSWPEIVRLAQETLPALILAGGWELDEPDSQILAENRAEGRIPTVTHPATRRRVIRAVAALADLEYQQRTWPVGAGDPITGSLAACLRTLTEDTHVLPDPGAAIGRVLLAGDEIDRLGTLCDALAPFTTVPPSQPWHSPGWTAVVAAALHCLPALVIAGAWLGPDPDTAPQTR